MSQDGGTGLGAAFAGSPVPTILAAGDGSIRWSNDAMVRLTGRSSGGLGAMKLSELIHPDDVPAALAPAGEEDQPREVRCIRQDGTPVWCAATTWTPAGSGEAVWLFRDISRRREAEEQLGLSRQRLRLLLENVEDYAIYFLDPEGRVASWNAGAQRIKGYTEAEIRGQHYRLFFTPGDVAAGLPEANLEAAARQRRAVGEGWRVRKDGSEFWSSWSLTALYDDDELVGFVKINRDITELRDARRDLQQYAEELEEANRSLRAARELQNDILGVAHHELRTPLTAVIGFAETLRHAWHRLSEEEIDTGLRAIETGGRRLQSLVENLLALSTMPSAAQSMRYDTVVLVTAVRDAAAMIGRDTDPDLVIDIPESVRVAGDPMRVRQIAANLLSNASIYGKPPVDVSARAAGGYVELVVADHGPGVEEAFVPELFGRFTQASRGTTRTSRGAGLGLAAVRELAEAQGGSARYEPNQPRGARFVVSLPAAG